MSMSTVRMERGGRAALAVMWLTLAAAGCEGTGMPAPGPGGGTARPTQADRARRLEVAPEQNADDPWSHPAHALVREDEFVEPMAERDHPDAEQAHDAHGGDCTGVAHFSFFAPPC